MKHGDARRNDHKRLYYVWYGMKARCYQPNATGYSEYGGRGIKVCTEWLDYETFKKWAYENGYDEDASYGECTIDRIDPNKNYEPNNCRWVNKFVQANNTRRNHFVTYNGETKTIAQWAKELDIDQDKLWSRLVEYKMPVDKAFSTCGNLDETYLTYNGQTHNLKEWSEITGIHVQTLSSRIHKLKWSAEKALTTKPKKRKENI